MEACSGDAFGDVPACLERREPVGVAGDYERSDMEPWQ
jgi:hypothetical protein